MPRYILKGNTASVTAGINSLDDVLSFYAAKSLEFFNNLSTKLRDLTVSLKNTFEDLKKKCGGAKALGPVMASITVPKVTMGIKYEYIEYIKRFGPPENGIFDEVLLEKLRIELNIITL